MNSKLCPIVCVCVDWQPFTIIVQPNDSQPEDAITLSMWPKMCNSNFSGVSGLRKETNLVNTFLILKSVHFLSEITSIFLSNKFSLILDKLMALCTSTKCITQLFKSIPWHSFSNIRPNFIIYRRTMHMALIDDLNIMYSPENLQTTRRVSSPTKLSHPTNVAHSFDWHHINIDCWPQMPAALSVPQHTNRAELCVCLCVMTVHPPRSDWLHTICNKPYSIIDLNCLSHQSPPIWAPEHRTHMRCVFAQMSPLMGFSVAMVRWIRRQFSLTIYCLVNNTRSFPSASISLEQSKHGAHTRCTQTHHTCHVRLHLHMNQLEYHSCFENTQTMRLNESNNQGCLWSSNIRGNARVACLEHVGANDVYA